MAKPTALYLRVIAVVLVTAIATSGCATKLRTVPTQPLARQTDILVERDLHESETAITGTLKCPWFAAELEYASCLTSSSYQVGVQVLHPSLELRKASLKAKLTPARITSDMVECERYAQDKVTVAEMVGRPALMTAGIFFFPAMLASLAASSTLLVFRERDYTACMEPRGYLV